ncbi:YqaH family protein [Bacillus sonorensis]|uniref:YqaH family protein n=1 Tax=Bacillus sonorensis TaxID=119858 RepID=UPI00098B1FEB|nr:YqaH family protein [Bacillus sonorensis]
MNLNHFLKSDREKAQRLYDSMQFMASELLLAAIEEGDFDGCKDIAESIAQHSKDLKKMEHPEKVVKLNEIASEFAKRGLNVVPVKSPSRRVH